MFLYNEKGGFKEVAMKKLFFLLWFCVLSSFDAFSYSYALKNTTNVNVIATLNTNLAFPSTIFIPAQSTGRGALGGFCFFSVTVFPQSSEFEYSRYEFTISVEKQCQDLSLKISKIGTNLKLERE